MNIKNPFRVGTEIRDSENFIGRKDILRTVSIAMSNLQNISLHGERRTGKTSLLLYLSNPAFASSVGLPSTYIPVYFNFQGIAKSSVTNVWQAITDAISDRIRERHPNGQTESERFQSTFKGPPELFVTELGKSLARLGNSGFNIHLLFDEFEQTADNPDLGDSFYDALRGLPTRAGNISYIIATRTGLAKLQPVYDKISSPFFNIFTTLTIYPFNGGEVQDLIFEYFWRAEIDYSLAEKLGNESSFLYDKTGYHPHFLQSLCYHLFTKLDKPDWPFGQAQEEALQAFKKDSEEHFKYYWKVSSFKEQMFIKKLATGHFINWNKSETKALAEVLKDRCLVVQSGKSRGKLFSSVFSEWVQMNCHKMVFICYANEDYNTALKLYEDIKRAGAIPWMSRKDILPGQNWEVEINNAIKNSSFFLALLSGNSISKKGFVQKELKTAFEQLEEFPRNDIFIIPVRLEECELFDEELQKIQWVDIFPSYDKGFKQISHVLTRNDLPFEEHDYPLLKKRDGLCDDSPMNGQNLSESDLSMQVLSQWLKDAGFKRNPFDKNDANYEPYLKEYFVKPLGFEDVLDNNSVVLYAPKGGGKTACHIMAEHACKTGYGLNNKVLCVSYNNIQEVFEQVNYQGSVAVTIYVKNILKNAVPKLFEKLMTCPEQKQKELEQLRQFMDNNINDPSDDHSSMQLMKSFVDLIKVAGFDSLFILINNTDNLCTACGDVYACEKALKHFIVENLRLTDNYRIFFKIFLPLEICTLMNQLESFFKTQKVKSVHIEWPEEKLREILKSRLKAATQAARGSPITSLDELSRTGFLRVDDVLLKYSKTPRELISLGEKILQTRLILTPDKDCITEQVLESVLTQISTE